VAASTSPTISCDPAGGGCQRRWQGDAEDFIWNARDCRLRSEPHRDHIGPPRFARNARVIANAANPFDTPRQVVVRELIYCINRIPHPQIIT
jgi:hypothetical protein